MKKLFREPLLHFLALGAVLFGLAALVEDKGGAPRERIKIAAGTIENLRVSFERSTGRTASAAEREALIEDYVREEILNREAIALGLHHDDPIVRQQVRQRMEFLEVEAAEPSPPTDQELQVFLEAHADQLRRDGGAGVPELTAIRPAVERAWRTARRREALDAAYAKFRARYTIEIERPPSGGSSP
jgi:hypothetical protein